MGDVPARIAAARPLFDQEDIALITERIASVLRSGRLILGPMAAELEAAFAKRVGTKHAVALSSCTAALEVVFRHLRVEGRDVIVPTNTFVATANAVRLAGGTPVLVDMSDAGDFGIDVSDALARLGPRTAAVVVVHIAGIIGPRVPELLEECRARAVPVVEDCAHAHGARIAGREAGSLGLAGCFSFYPTKILTSGTGGMLTTDDDDLAELARSLRHHGQGDSLEDIVRAGNDWVLDEVRCVIAQAQLGRLDAFLERRRAIAQRYEDRLGGDGRFVLPRPSPGSSAAWYKYPVLLPEGVDPRHVRQVLAGRGIELGALYYPPVHLMPLFHRELGTSRGACPKAERILSRQVTLPMHAALVTADADRAVDALLSALDEPR